MLLKYTLGYSKLMRTFNTGLGLNESVCLTDNSSMEEINFLFLFIYRLVYFQLIKTYIKTLKNISSTLQVLCLRKHET